MDQEEKSPWQYKPDGTPATGAKEKAGNIPAPAAAPLPRHRTISWEASEFVEHDHGPGWYGLLVLATLALAAGMYLLSKDRMATGIIIAAGIILGVYAGQKPRRVKYQITSSGISVDGKLYRYVNYKSFTVVREGDLSSVNLFPLKRLMPPLTAYFDSADEVKVMQVLGDYLPYENRPLDSIERISRRIRL